MNTQQQSELKVFPLRATRREKMDEKNHLAANLSRNSNSVTNKQHQQRRLTQVKIV